MDTTQTTKGTAAMMNDWKEQQAARELAAQTLAAAHPHLIPVSMKNDSLIAATKNIRIELAAHFPGVKFSVHSKRYSGGNSVRVYWIDGPTSKQVESIINAYAAGNFDGMTDSYSYSDDRAWNDAFGSSMYVFAERSYSDKLLCSVIGRIARRLGGLDRQPTVEDYRSGRMYNILQSGGCDLWREVNVALSRHTCAVGVQA
jgi:hypothetical protein